MYANRLAKFKRKLSLVLMITFLIFSTTFMPLYRHPAKASGDASILLNLLLSKPFVKVNEYGGDNRYPHIVKEGTHDYIVWQHLTYDENKSLTGAAIDFKSNDTQTANLSSPLQYAMSPEIAAFGSKVYVVWEEQKHTGKIITEGIFTQEKIEYDIWLAISNDYGVHWQTPLKLSNSGYAQNPTVAAAGKYVYVAWNERISTGESQIMVRKSSDYGNNFGAALELKSGKSSDIRPAAVVCSDKVYIAWIGCGSGDGTNNVFFAGTTTTEDNFSKSQNLGGAPDGNFDLALSVSGNNVYTAWCEVMGEAAGGYGRNTEIFYRASHDGGKGFGAAVNISNTKGVSVAPQIAAFGNNVFLLWEDLTFGYDVFFRASSDAGTSFGNAYVMNTSGGLKFDSEYADIAVIGSNISVVWGGDFGTAASGNIYKKVLETNHKPMADTGTDYMSVDLGEEVRLDGSRSSDEDGDSISYHWYQTGGPSVDMTGVNTAQLHFKAPDMEVSLQFKLIVNDGIVDSEPAVINISVGRPDLELFRVSPLQSIVDPEYLIEGKKTLVEAEIINTGKEQTVPVELVYEAVEVGKKVEKAIAEDIALKHGLNKVLLPSKEYIEPFKVEGAADTFKVSITIDPDNKIDESNEGNNSTEVSMKIKKTRPLKLVYLPVDFEITPGLAQAPSVNDIISYSAGSKYLKAVYPIDEDKVQEVFSDIPFTPVINKTFNGKLGDEEVRELYQQIDILKWFYKTDSPDAVTKLIGIVRPNWFADNLQDTDPILGMAFSDLDVCVADEREASGETLVHELAHTFDWVSGSPPGMPDNSAHIDEDAQGYWIEKRQFVQGKDFMYPSNTRNMQWVGKTTWNYLTGVLGKDLVDPPVIGIRGTIFKNDTASFDSWYRFESTEDIPLNNAGEYSILYLSDSGSLLAQTGFNLTFKRPAEQGGGEGDASPLSLRIPEVAGTGKIVIKHGTAVLGERIITPQSPAVAVTAPNGGETYRPGETVTVNWQSEDKDGGKLCYVVSLSQDGGKSWMPVAVDLTAQEYTFKVPQGVVSDKMLVKVTASDGINTGEDVSDAVFTITDYVPTEKDKFTSAVNVSNDSGSSYAPSMAVSGEDVYLAWRDHSTSNGNADVFFKVSYDGGKTFGSVSNLSSNSGISTNPQIKVNGSDVYVMWLDNTGGKWNAYLKVSHDKGQSFGNAVSLSSAGVESLPSIAFSGDNVYVSWHERVNASDIGQDILFRASHDRGNSFSGIINLGSNYEGSTYPVLGASGDNVYLCWDDNSSIMMRKSTDKGASFGQIVKLNTDTELCDVPRMEVAGNDVHIVWNTMDSNGNRKKVIYRSSSDSGSSFAAPVQLAASSNSYLALSDMKIAGDNVYVSMLDSQKGGEPGTVMLICSSNKGASFGSVINVSGGTGLRPALSAQGDNVYVIWRVDDMSDPRVMFRASKDKGHTFGPQSVINESTNAVNMTDRYTLSENISADSNVYISWVDRLAPFNLEIFFSKGTISSGTANRIPCSNAGLDQTVNEGSAVTLDGRGSSDGDGDQLSYSWTQVGGPAVSLSNANTSSPSFTASRVEEQTVLTFRLTVSDGKSSSLADDVNITVDNIPVQANQPPTAEPAEAVTEVNSPVFITLTGKDPEEAPISFSITAQPQHGKISLRVPVGSSSVKIGYVPDFGFIGTDSFTFKTNDGILDSNSARVTVEVKGDTTNSAPCFTSKTPPLDSVVTGGLGNTISFTVEAEDKDEGDIVSIMPLNLPSGARFEFISREGGKTSGILSWIPASPGENMISFLAFDSHGAYTEHRIKLSAQVTDTTNPGTTDPDNPEPDTDQPQIIPRTGSFMDFSMLIILGIITILAGTLILIRRSKN